jgi:hypothetical protein
VEKAVTKSADVERVVIETILCEKLSLLWATMDAGGAAAARSA